jgi:hypothetical protein
VTRAFSSDAEAGAIGTACRPSDRNAGRQIRDVSLFWLKYLHRDRQFAGAVVIEATALFIARMQAAVFGVDEGLIFAGGYKIDDASAHRIPESMTDRLLDHRDLRRLHRLLLTEKPFGAIGQCPAPPKAATAK